MLVSKNREINQSRGNKTHLIFFDQQHSGKINDDKSKTTNFNFSGPVNVKQDINSIPFGSKNLNASQKVSITRDSNKSQQLIPDTNSTLDYTAVCISSNIGVVINNSSNNKAVLENVTNPTTAKHSPHNVFVRRQKKSRQSNYYPSGSKKSSNLSNSVNPSKPSIENEYVGNNTSNSNCSKFGSSSASNPSNNETDSGNAKQNRKQNKSEEKHLETTQRDMKAILQLEEQLQLASSGIANNEKANMKLRINKLKENVAASSPSRGSVLTNPQQPGGRFGSELNNSNVPESFPLKPGKAMAIFKNILSEYEKGEILNYREIFCVGEPAANQKIKGSLLKENNCGYDDERGDYKVVLKDHLCYRFEIIEKLGQGSFGQAFKCLDHKTGDHVAVKIIKNDPTFQYQAGIEVKILTHLRDGDPHDKNNIIRLIEVFNFRNHLCIVFELLSLNLYDFLKQGNFKGLSLSLIRRFAIQILYALNYIKCENIIHCDLKPENIILKDPNKSGIKVIDFGSSCFVDQQLYTYIQSRFYRAPEIIFGIRYSNAIDMWSFGCILAELYTGFPIFPGETEHDQVGYMMEINGLPPIELLKRGKRSHIFFDSDGFPIPVPNSKGKIRMPNTKYLHEVLECKDEPFLEFLERCFEWIPEDRLSPHTALRHEWILEGLPPHILVHHMRLHDIQDDDLPYKIRMNLEKYRKALNKVSSNNAENKAESKPLSTGRKPTKQKIITQINHVAVAGDMITLRNKDKKVNIKKGIEESLIENLNLKTNHTRNKELPTNSKNDLSVSNGGDSMKQLDDLMSVGLAKKPSNQNFVLKKNTITFKPLRNRFKNKAIRKENVENKDCSMDYKSMPHKISETAENNLGCLIAKQSRNKAQESFAPAELNNMINKEKPILRNNFFA